MTMKIRVMPMKHILGSFPNGFNRLIHYHHMPISPYEINPSCLLSNISAFEAHQSCLPCSKPLNILGIDGEWLLIEADISSLYNVTVSVQKYE